MKLRDKVCIVTGSASGIGLAIAKNTFLKVPRSSSPT